MIPPDILQAVADKPRGRVAIVTGAGTSVDPPTSLPLAGDLAFETHRRLVRDGLLDQQACPDPRDLAAVADAVERAGHELSVIVQRMDRQRLILAQPNAGHLTAAALLLEGAIAAVYTLNFDLALKTALASLGTNGRVAIVAGPSTHPDAGAICLIYLHGTADSEPDSLVLTSRQLENHWRDRWQEIVAARLMGTPIVIFAGLGTPGSLLVHTARKIHAAAAGSTYQVDAAPFEESLFAEALAIPRERYLQSGWLEFMAGLGRAVLDEEAEDLRRATGEIAGEDNVPPPVVIRCMELIEQIPQLSLAEFGLVRSYWLLSVHFCPWDALRPRWIARLLLVVASIAEHLSATPRFRTDGLVEFWREQQLLLACAVAHGRAELSAAAADALILAAREGSRPALQTVRIVLTAGLEGQVPMITAPADIISEDPADIVAPREPITLRDGWTYVLDPTRVPELLQIYNG